MQRTANRSALALIALSAGVPMITGGDELARTQRGNNNPYNLDSSGNWIDWSISEDQASFRSFTSRLFAFRNSHVALRPRTPWAAAADGDGDGRPEVVWLSDGGTPVDDAYLDDAGLHFLGWMLDGDDLGDEASALLVLYNGWDGGLNITLPDPPAGSAWVSYMDTTTVGDAFDHFHDTPVAVGSPYYLGARGVGLLVAR